MVAENVEPPEIVAHIPLLCDERKAPYVYVNDKRRIGSAVGLSVGAAAAVVEEAGEAKNLLDEIVSKVKEIVK